jgi:SSS family solute:Na+ symporter
MISFGAAVLLVLVIFLGIGIFSGKGSSGEKFSLGGRQLSSRGVGGIILGALVGGASTVGTAEMAYVHGFSAWWFTLGGGLGCLLLGLLFASPLRRTRLTTIPQFLEARFGKKVAHAVLLAMVMGTFLSVVAQFFAGKALLGNLFPLSEFQGTLVVALLVLGFIFFGGLKSYSALGEAKILFLYGVLGICALVAYSKGVPEMSVTRIASCEASYGLFSRGVGRDLASGFSLIIGVLSTQIYIQALYGARDEKTARRGAFLGALLMPPLGILGIFIGLSVRSLGVVLPPSQVLPYFLTTFFPPFVSGLLWGGILITIIGCAAGLSLGMATNVIHDLLLPRLPRSITERVSLLSLDRLGVLFVVLCSTGVALTSGKAFILQWSYLSMGLRGAGSFFPLFFGVLFPRILPPFWALASSLGGIGGTLLLGSFIRQGETALMGGFALSGVMALTGAVIHYCKNDTSNNNPKEVLYDDAKKR